MSDEDLLAGTPYRAGRAIGRGASGVVIEAEHRALGKRVVAKILRPECASSASMVDRLRLEAQALARLSHPNLVQVFDFGQTSDHRPFLVMERLDGVTLKEEIARRGALPVGEALELTRQLLSGLAEAHGAGLVHRDIKPENLFLCEATQGRPRTLKILDFGLAKVLSTTDPSGPQPLAIPTTEGFALGTPRYFAPEQAYGSGIDQRTDLYAVGGVLYTLLAGRDPFHHRRGIVDLLKAHAAEIPRNPSELAAVPAELDAIVMKALAKRQDDRYATAALFLAALARVRSASAASAPRWPSTELVDVRQLSAHAATDPGHLQAAAEEDATTQERAPKPITRTAPMPATPPMQAPLPPTAPLPMRDLVRERLRAPSQPAPSAPRAALPPPQVLAPRAELAAGSPLQRMIRGPWRWVFVAVGVVVGGGIVALCYMAIRLVGGR